MKEINQKYIKNITLLSRDEAEKLPQDIRKFSTWWWLRSVGVDFNSAAYVFDTGIVNYLGYDVNNTDPGVRPALICDNLESLDFKIGDYVTALGKIWQYIGNDMILLSGEPLTRMAFRKESDAPDANVYEKSDVKKYLDNWLKTNKSYKYLLYCNTTGENKKSDDLQFLLKIVYDYLESGEESKITVKNLKTGKQKIFTINDIEDL